MVGLASYDNGAKQTWRGWQWNQIGDRINRVNRKGSTAIYLCGPDDFDRECGRKRDFQNHNLVAVDLDEAICQRVRQGGGFSVNGHLTDLVAMWPGNDPIGCIIADFTGGHTAGSVDLMIALTKGYAAREGTVVSINLLRGRDPWSNEFRRHLAATLPRYCAGFNKFYGDRNLADETMHRGLHWVIGACHDMSGLFCHWNPNTDRARLFIELFRRMAPSFSSYKSRPGDSVQVFDSAVLTWPLNSGPHETKLRPTRQEMESWRTMRRKRHEGGSPVRFDYQSYVARLAQLRADRNRIAVAQLVA